jgi:hypothetical protein
MPARMACFCTYCMYILSYKKQTRAESEAPGKGNPAMQIDRILEQTYHFMYSMYAVQEGHSLIVGGKGGG